jgi:RNA polymerase sigma factor (sigma-70 family)
MEAGTVPRVAAPRIPMPGSRLIRLASDARLVTLVREGRAGAFEAVYDRHHRGILSFCRHMLRDQHEAEDALQHTFMAAYSSLLASQQPIQLRPWLFAIARNRCYSVLRSQRERPVAELDEPITEGLTAEVQRRQDLRDLVGDLNRLPDEQRAAIVLAELESLSHAEIAEVLGVPRDKVKALVFQARESLLASRTARDTSCHEIREELAVGRGAALRRANLRRHLRDCEGCRAYRAQVQRQRRQFGLLLPIGPTILAKEGVLAAAVGAGGAVAVGGSGLIASSALKTGVLKAVAAAVIAGVGTLGTVVVSASDLPVRTLEAGTSGHHRAGPSVLRAHHHAAPALPAPPAGSSASTSTAPLSGRAADASGRHHQAGATAGRHGRAWLRRQGAAWTRRHGGPPAGYRHAAPSPAPGGRAILGRWTGSAGSVAPGPAHRALWNLPPGQARKLAQAASRHTANALVAPRVQVHYLRPGRTWSRLAADGPPGHLRARPDVGSRSLGRTAAGGSQVHGSGHGPGHGARVRPSTAASLVHPHRLSPGAYGHGWRHAIGALSHGRLHGHR